MDIEGNKKSLSADTFCIHGDHPAALDMLRYIHQQLQKKKIFQK